jgi:Ni/Co efflux regulator RcnB
MKKLSITFISISTALMFFTSLSLAQGDERHGNPERNRGQQQSGQNEAHRNGYQHDSNQRTQERFDQREERWNERRPYYNARSQEFRRGGYIPREYYNHMYVVNDYRIHDLPKPPHNHQWVQVGADYVLIAIATGIIASIVLNN